MEIYSHLLLARVNVTNVAANGPIGLASATVDIAACVAVPQTTVGRILTLPTPTDFRDGRQIVVTNTGDTPFSMHGRVVPRREQALFGYQDGNWCPLVNGADQLLVITGSTTLTMGIQKVIIDNTISAVTVTLPDPAVALRGARVSMSRAPFSTGGITVNVTGPGQVQALSGTFGATTSIAAHSATGAGLGIEFWSDGSNWYR